jgi:glycosyltransferase involved in cell wall biosynthesis
MKIFGLSDPLTMPTGFGRVARELFSRLAGTGKYELGYLSAGGDFPGIARPDGITYFEGLRFCQAEFPNALRRFAGDETAVLWTLMDPWQTSWLAFPETSPLALAPSQEVRAIRDRLAWIMYFPIDGEGPYPGRPPRWVEQYAEAADYPVVMSEWARRILQPLVKKEVRFISHAVDTSVFKPLDKDRCRATVEGIFIHALVAQAMAEENVPENERSGNVLSRLAPRIAPRRLVLDGKFVVLCVMANRSRKYWWDVLRAVSFARAKLDRPMVLLGVCGDLVGAQEGALPLYEICRELGFRMPGDVDPDTWLLETAGGDAVMALLYGAADTSILISGGEGFGLPQLESHACGRPCIVGDYSASTELAVNERELIRPRGVCWWEGSNQTARPLYDYREIGQRLVWAARNPAWAAEVGEAGVEQAEGRSWDRIFPAWEALLAEAYGGLRSSSREGMDKGRELRYSSNNVPLLGVADGR